MWGDMGMGWGGGWGILSGLHMVLWWVLLILGIVVLFRLLIGGSLRSGRETTDRALEILKERYARGEIGKEEYEQKKRDLET
ncbi:MAG: SHOCT domain-containing protein [Burkholderiales bacterium]